MLEEKLNVFIAYAHEDEAYCEQLQRHLSPLIRNDFINVWYDRIVGAGKEWRKEIKMHLDESRLILLLISPDFINSAFCYDFEMKRAMERHASGSARVVPVIVRPCLWMSAPFGKLQPLPRNVEPVTSPKWSAPDYAYVEIAKGIQEIVEELMKGSAIEVAGPEKEPDVLEDTPKDNIGIRTSEKVITRRSPAETLSPLSPQAKSADVSPQPIDPDPETLQGQPSQHKNEREGEKIQSEMLFRPSLVIFVDEAGKGIYERLKRICRSVSLEVALWQGIGLIQVTDPKSNSAEEILLSQDASKNKGALENLVEIVLHRIQSDKTIKNITSAGYSVPNPHTRIYIVGDIASPHIAKALRGVREQLRKDKIDTSVCYILSATKGLSDISLDKTFIVSSDQTRDWAQREVPDFCYLYENIRVGPGPYYTFVREEETDYASAEALFALIATGIAEISPLKEETEIKQPIPYYENIGTLSTSLILFPRESIRRYCGARLSADLVRKQHQDCIKSAVSGQARRELQLKARTTAKDIETWLRDTTPRLGAEDHLGPSLLILQQKKSQPLEPILDQRMELHSRLADLTRELFDCFSIKLVTHEYQRYKSTRTWPDIAYGRGMKAENSFNAWMIAAKSAWAAATDRIGDEVKQVVDDLLSTKDNGFEGARIYLNELDDQLYNLQDEVAQWRAEHYAAHTESRRLFSLLAEGQWKAAIDEQTMSSAKPSAETLVKDDQGTPADVTDHLTTGGAGESGKVFNQIKELFQTILEPPYLPPLEAEIERNLRARIIWKQKRIPLSAKPFVIGLLVWLAITLSIYLLRLPLALLVAISASVGIGFGIGAFLFRYQRLRGSVEAQNDLLTFYRDYYAYKCEAHEDIQRLGLVRYLRARVSRTRSRIDNMPTFLMSIYDQFMSESKYILDDLFDDPVGACDIFIAGGEQLQKDRQYTLDNIVSQLTRSRIHRPTQVWHSSLDHIMEELIRTFRSSQGNLLLMPEDTLEQYIYDFATNVIDDYLTDSLTEIRPAMGQSGVWDEAFDHIRRPFYRLQRDEYEHRLLFVCGHDYNISRGGASIPKEALIIHIKNPEWVLVASFFKGASRTSLNRETLFPYRSDS
jgi:TIR domain